MIPRPFLKWAGGKGQLLDEILPRVPTDATAYLEPFLGGGAVFFALARAGRLPPTVILSDANADLILAYREVRDMPEGVIAYLKQWPRDEETYYWLRKAKCETDTGLAARLIWLNKNCFNGLYRTNSRGEFNVPFGKYPGPYVPDEENILACSEALRGVTVLCQPYEQTLAMAPPGGFAYLDPPYAKVSETSFTGYGTVFGDAEQSELARRCQWLPKLGVRALLSNADVPAVRQWYQWARIEGVQASRRINRSAEGRGPVGEVLVTI